MDEEMEMDEGDEESARAGRNFSISSKLGGKMRSRIYRSRLRWRSQLRYDCFIALYMFNDSFDSIVIFLR